jgi:hypothetical protein
MAATKTEQFKQILSDRELRENALDALRSLQHAVEETRAEGQTISKKAEKKLKKSKKAAKAAAPVEAAQEKPGEAQPQKDQPKNDQPKKKCRCRRLRRLFVVAVLGAIVAVIVSEDARKAALDLLFGAEEEFQYTSHTGSAGSNGTS